jgi:hypothetical protein
MRHYDLTVAGARQMWTKIRWALFVFPDILDVAPTGDPAIVRIFYEGTRPYPNVWRVALLQSGFDVPALDSKAPSTADLAMTSLGSRATPARRRVRGRVRDLR